LFLAGISKITHFLPRRQHGHQIYPCFPRWQGIAPSGRTATWTVIIIGRFAGGRIIEDWVEYDRLGLYRQLDEIPLAEG
jgi:hypothetical protein